MFHPVGSQPPSVYWRRRLLLIGTIALVVVLLAVTVHALTASSGGTPVGAGTGPASSTPATTPRSTASSPRTRRSSSPPDGSAKRRTGRTSTTSTSGSSSPTPVACRASDLDVSAVVGKDSYSLGQKPMVELQVVNVGADPCIQDLADSQIVLKVYNGESRVWGSHDCEIQPGTDKKVLAVSRPVSVSVTWSGLSSQPKCAGTRQHVGAGTYTLYAALSGHTGKAAQFTIN